MRRKMDAPDEGLISRLVEIDGEPVIEAFAPVISGGRIGWVRAEIGMEGARAAMAHAGRAALISAMLVSVVTLGVLYAFIGYALSPKTLIYGKDVPGYPSLVVGLMVLGGLITVFGLIGRIEDEVCHRKVCEGEDEEAEDFHVRRAGTLARAFRVERTDFSPWHLSAGRPVPRPRTACGESTPTAPAASPR